MKKLLLTIMSICMCFSIFMISPKAEETTSQESVEEGSQAELAKSAKGAYLMEFTSGKVIYAKNETEKLYPASMTKMMGMLLIFEALNSGKLSWDDVVTTSEHAASMGGSQVFLEPNESMSVKDMVKSISIASANDAMVAVAEKIGGTHEGFVKMMNEKAKELNLVNTNFVNATGLHDANHYSCAKDMAMIAQALVKEGGEELLEITSTYDSYIREDSEKKFWLVNTNKLLKQYDGVDGLKTGFTQEAMSCITVTAKRDNLRLISVVMGEPSSKVRNEEEKTLLDYGFSQYSQGTLYSAGTVMEERTIDNGKPDKVNPITTQDLVYVFEKGSEPIENEKIIELTKTELPYNPGDIVGKVTIKMSDGFVIEGDLTVDHEVMPLDYLDIFMKTFTDLFS